MPEAGNFNLKQVDTTPQHGLGDWAQMPGGGIAKYFKYNDGDGNIPGLRGQIAYRVGANAANVTMKDTVTCDLGSATIVSTDEFAGIVLANVILNNEYGWFQDENIGEVDAWAVAAIDRSGDTVVRRCIPGATDGIVATLTAGFEQRVCFELLADVIVTATVTLSTDRYLGSIPLGQTTAAQFVVGETVTANTDTAVVVEVLKRGTKDYGLIVSTLTDNYWVLGETVVGSTSGASGVLGAVGFAVKAGNYNIVYQR